MCLNSSVLKSRRNKMDIRNRMNDVVKLRCNACQVFLKMIISDNWQQDLYKIASSKRNEMVYDAVYKKMRDSGVEQFTIDDMDVTTIYEIIKDTSIINKRIDNITFNCLKRLKDDRNTTNHSSENEDADTLYERALRALFDLSDFITAVDERETTINESLRLEYRQSYRKKIDDLKKLLADERDELYSRTKRIDKDIARILDSTRPLDTWLEIYNIYFDKSYKTEKDQSLYEEFVIRASDAGIHSAHYQAALVFWSLKNDSEAENRIIKYYESIDRLDKMEAHNILEAINYFLSFNKPITTRLQRIIDDLIQEGFDIEQNNSGYWKLKKNK